MSDIVERLREDAKMPHALVTVGMTMREAADEIERLRHIISEGQKVGDAYATAVVNAYRALDALPDRLKREWKGDTP